MLREASVHVSEGHVTFGRVALAALDRFFAKARAVEWKQLADPGASA